jgi:hypothetical protein
LAQPAPHEHIIRNSTNVRYLEPHDLYKKLLIEGLADLKLHQIVIDLFNQWNTMVFPQAKFEIIPDSQAQSADEGSTSNPKNPDVADCKGTLNWQSNHDLAFVPTLSHQQILGHTASWPP